MASMQPSHFDALTFSSIGGAWTCATVWIDNCLNQSGPTVVTRTKEKHPAVKKHATYPCLDNLPPDRSRFGRPRKWLDTEKITIYCLNWSHNFLIYFDEFSSTLKSRLYKNMLHYDSLRSSTFFLPLYYVIYKWQWLNQLTWWLRTFNATLRKLCIIYMKI